MTRCDGVRRTERQKAARMGAFAGQGFRNCFFIRSAPTEPLPARTPAFPAMRRAERGSVLLLEIVAKSSSVQELRRRYAYSRLLSGMSGGALCAMDEWAIPRPLAEKSTRRCGLSSDESGCPAHGAPGAFLRSIKKKRAAFFLKFMRRGGSNPRENE